MLKLWEMGRSAPNNLNLYIKLRQFSQPEVKIYFFKEIKCVHLVY